MRHDRLDHHGRGMGSDVHLVAVGPTELLPNALERAWRRLGELEDRWSRFRPDSELCRLNRDGRIDDASSDLIEIVAAALDAWRATEARFDPTVHDALVAAGYDRSFEQLEHADRLSVAPGASPADDRPTTPAPGPVGIVIDPVSRRVELPRGVHLDLGGIGKGFAADLLARQLIADGAAGACVNIGGDVRAVGAAGGDEVWVVGIEDPFRPGHELTRVAIGEGAVATSALVRRRWRTASGAEAHHLIDPATGRPARRGLIAVTVLAAEARWAEVLAKAAFMAGIAEGVDLIEQSGACGLLITDEGEQIRTSGFADYEPESVSPDPPESVSPDPPESVSPDPPESVSPDHT